MYIFWSSLFTGRSINFLIKQISGIVRGQRQVMHQLDNLSNLLHESMGERSHQGRKTKKSNWPDAEPFKVPLIITLAAGGVGIFLFKKFLTRNWSWLHPQHWSHFHIHLLNSQFVPCCHQLFLYSILGLSAGKSVKLIDRFCSVERVLRQLMKSLESYKSSFSLRFLVTSWSNKFCNHRGSHFGNALFATYNDCRDQFNTKRIESIFSTSLLRK